MACARQLSGAIYRLGLALFDLQAPERCLKRSDEWVFGPQEDLRATRRRRQRRFSLRHDGCADGDTLRLYYGAADTSIAMATGSIRAMLQRLENTPEGNKRFEDMDA